MKSQAQPHLIALSEGISIPLDKPIILIGRHQECDIQVPSRKISRRHCCIALVNDHLVIRDLGSTNGIRINGVKVLEGQLEPEDELIIGNVSYRVKWSGDADGTVRAPDNQGIKSGPPPVGKSRNESVDQPMPLPNDAISLPILSGKPAPAKASNGAASKAPPLDFSGEIGLVPLDPAK